MCRRVQSAKLWLLGPRQLNTNGPSIVQRWVCGNCTLDPVTTPGVVRNRGLSRLAGLTADQRDHLSQMLSAGPNPQRTPEDWRGAAARGEPCAFDPRRLRAGGGTPDPGPKAPDPPGVLAFPWVCAVEHWESGASGPCPRQDPTPAKLGNYLAWEIVSSLRSSDQVWEIV